MDRRERFYPWLAIALLIACPMAIALPIVSHPPVFDDHLLLGGNADLLEGRLPAREALFRRYWGAAPEAAVNELYRPVTIASLAADARLFGSGPRGMHVTALALHAANTLLVYCLVTLLFGRRLLSFLTALLFSVHPIVLEVIAPISGRSDLLAALFLLCASCLGLLFARGSGRRASLALAGMTVACAAGVLSKEHVVTAPLVLAALLLAAGADTARRPRVVVAFCAALCGVLAAVGLRFAALGYTWRSGLPADPQGSYLAWVGNPLLETGVLSRLLTVFKIVANALGLLLLPVRQSADYCYDQIVVEEGLPGLVAMLGLGVTIASIAVLVRWRQRHPVLWIATAWGGLTFLVTSNAVVPIGAIFAERFLYLPAIAASLVVAALLTRIASGGRGRRLAAGALTLTLAGLCVTLFIGRRNDWSSDAALFAATAQASPRCARGHSNHGLVLMAEGRLDEAVAAYQRALDVAPKLTGTGISLTGALLDLDRSEEAVDVARRTAAAAGDDAVTHRLLADQLVAAGLRAVDAGDDRRFLVTTQAAAAIDPLHGAAHFNLALHAWKAGDAEAARRHARDALAAHYVLPPGFLEAVEARRDAAPAAGH